MIRVNDYGSFKYTNFIHNSNEMARVCEICGRGSLTGNIRSHSNIASKRKQHLNLQQTVVDGKKVKACARCIKLQTKKAQKS